MPVEFSCEDLGKAIREYKQTRSDPLLSKFDFFCLFLVLCNVLHQIFFYHSIRPTVVLCSLVVFCVFRGVGKMSMVKEESLLIIQELGVQIKRRYYSGKERHLFIDRTKIVDIIINEGFTMHSVIFYMAFIVQGKDKMVLPFEHFYPRLDSLLKVYRGTRSIIFGEPDEPSSDPLQLQ
eukprot:GILI01028241.1.p1 GENE.GILI01028241.1~~GILI01028241.1.p1  ORF type:complete len:178 (+),score=29.46 GILI01028241.1:40-573(+)